MDPHLFPAYTKNAAWNIATQRFLGVFPYIEPHTECPSLSSRGSFTFRIDNIELSKVTISGKHRQIAPLIRFYSISSRS